MRVFKLNFVEGRDDAADGLKKALLKDVKKRIDEIHKKYILPQEQTFDFAMMYVQSEGVLNEILMDASAMAYARETLGLEFSEAQRSKRAIHPLVATNPRTLRQSIYVASHAFEIIDWPVPDGRLLLRLHLTLAPQRDK